MKATEIRPGARFEQFDRVIYEVLSVGTDQDGDVVAAVKFTDGGTGLRVWGVDDDVPLVAS